MGPFGAGHRPITVVVMLFVVILSSKVPFSRQEVLYSGILQKENSHSRRNQKLGEVGGVQLAALRTFMRLA